MVRSNGTDVRYGNPVPDGTFPPSAMSLGTGGRTERFFAKGASSSYDDLRRTVRITSPLDANRSLVAATTYDWLGRAIRTGATDDAGQHPASD
jgi:hypothetical protein